MNQSHNRHTPKIIGSVALVAVLVIGIYTLLINKQTTATVALVSNPQPTETALNSLTQSSNNVTAPKATTSTTTYVDGSYTKTVSYRVPGGDTNTLTAIITIRNGLIDNVTATNTYRERDSRIYVNSFDSSISKTVSGKKLDDAYVGRVGGASLTSDAFNYVIDTVIKDAKA